MAYCTKADILDQIDEDILVQLTDDDDTGSVVDAKVTAAIGRADEEIDGYCGKRYSVPFSTVPGRVRDLSVDIAIYHLYGRRKGAPDQREKNYNNAIRFLEKIAGNKGSLGENDPDGTPAETHKPKISQSDRIFTRDKMDGF